MSADADVQTADPLRDVHHRLDQIEAKLDTLLQRGEPMRDLMDEVGPIAQSMGRAAVTRFAELEEKGYFAFGRQALNAFDRVVGAYSEADLAAFADAAVHITDTVRDLTQPEVLGAIDAAGRAAAEGGQPLSAWAAMKATRDPEVQRGMAVVFAVLRALGRPREEGERRALPAPRSAPAASETAPAPRPARPAPSVQPAAPAVACSQAEIVQEAAVEGGRFDRDGFLLDPGIWTPALGAEIAAHLGVDMTDEHWRAVNWARADWQETGASPNVRRIATGSELGTRTIYTLFPRQPGKTIARIAGTPKPVGCL